MFFWEKDSVAAVKIETSCLGDDGELDASVCEDAFEADSLSGPGEGGGVGYASWPEWDLDCQVERKLSSPLTFGRSHWYVIGRGEVGGRERTCSSISAELAICGTHFGATKEPASMVVKPVFASLSTKSIFVASGTVCFSFCNPSRGPTSTMRTWSARLEAAEAKARRWHG